MNDVNSKFKLRFYEIAISLCLAGVSGLVAWNTRTIYLHEQQLVQITASRFTASDGLVVWKELAAIREAMAKLPREYPPADYAKMIEQRFASVEARDEKVERTIENINTLLRQNREDIIAIRVAVEKYKP